MAKAASSPLEDLELSGEEVQRLTSAFQDPKFRRMFSEYAEELTDPENRRRYEEEITALERERGVEVRFVHPEPGHVLRTSLDGARRCFVNVCSNALVGAPSSRPSSGSAASGSQWSLPYSLAPGREYAGGRGIRYTVYDVVFHPDALALARRYERFRQMLDATALEAVEKQFGVKLDRRNAKTRCSRDSAPSTVPHELVVTIELPLLRSAEQAALEVTGKLLCLDSRKPDYQLRLSLPYRVDDSRGKAQFNKARRQLVVTLPVAVTVSLPELAATPEEAADRPGTDGAACASARQGEAGPAGIRAGDGGSDPGRAGAAGADIPAPEAVGGKLVSEPEELDFGGQAISTARIGEEPLPRAGNPGSSGLR